MNSTDFNSTLPCDQLFKGIFLQLDDNDSNLGSAKYFAVHQLNIASPSVIYLLYIFFSSQTAMSSYQIQHQCQSQKLGYFVATALEFDRKV